MVVKVGGKLAGDDLLKDAGETAGQVFKLGRIILQEEFKNYKQ